MALPSKVNNFYVTQADGRVFLQWDIAAGATSYNIQRSTDGVNFVSYANPTVNQYLDTSVTLGTAYWYQVAAATQSPAYAQGTLSFSGQPVAGESFSVANEAFQAVASGATGQQFNIGATVAETVANIKTAVEAATSLDLIITVASTNSTSITFQAYDSGIDGNGLQFSSALSNSSISAFAGGVTGTTGIYTPAQMVVPTMGGEMSLSELATRCRQRADRLNSDFVTLPELNSYINQSMFELYDLLIDVYEDYFKAPAAIFYSVGANQQLYPMPDGVTTFLDQNLQPFVPRPIYKLLGLDMGLNTGNNGWVTVGKFNYLDRNKFFYPTPGSTIYGVFNCLYRWMGNKLELIPTPAANQPFRIQYIPRLQSLLQPTDMTDVSISGWLEYVITDVAIKILQKEESDVSVLMAQKVALKARIEESANNRDAGRPDTITDVRTNGWYNTGSGGYGGFPGGY